MASSGAMFAASAGLNVASSIGNAYAQSQAISAQTTYQRNLSNINKNFSELYAEDALRRGREEEAGIRKKVRQTVGAQRAALAAQGIDVGAGSAIDIISDTREQGALDIVTVKNNAFREAWGYKVSALQASMEGKFAEISGNFSKKMTLLTGGTDALRFGLEGYSKYRKP